MKNYRSKSKIDQIFDHHSVIGADWDIVLILGMGKFGLVVSNRLGFH